MRTPGPWKVWNDRIWTDESLAEMREICSISGNRGDRDANAEFIVRACNAAPELLEACITALGYIARTSTSGGKPPAIINLLRAAIARAGGE